jgi:hypothetical protein
LADSEADSNGNVFHIEGGIPVFNTRLDQIQREQEEAKQRDEQYRKEQLRLNRRMTWFTGLLVFIGFLGFLINAYQSHIAAINAGAAQDNAAAAKMMVEEMKKTGTDTHELAVQAKNQSTLARQTIENVRSQFQEEQRPYISFTNFFIMDMKTGQAKAVQDFDIGKPLMVNVLFKNIGKRKAINPVIHYHIVFGKNINQIKVEASDKGRYGSDLDSGKEGTVTAISLTDPYTRESVGMNPADLLNWDGSQPIVLFGRVSYKDDAGKVYCTPLLMHRLPENWANVSQFNGVSENDLCPENVQ